MRRGAVLAAVLLSAAIAAGCSSAPAATSEPSPNEPEPTMPEVTRDGLVWRAEFDAAAGTSLDTSEWSISNRGDGYGNSELQVYTPRPDNVSHNGEGSLVLSARDEAFTDPRGFKGDYTSGRIETTTRFQHGRIEARINAPVGAGLWSAFWLFGDSLAGEDWPAVGEVDIVELLGNTLDLHNSVIGATTSGERWIHNTSTYTGNPWGGEWHLYAVEWDADVIVFTVDDDETYRLHRSDLGESEEWPFDRPYSITLNLAVGGDWPGAPTEETVFPAEMLIDYIRVYDARVVTP